MTGSTQRHSTLQCTDQSWAPITNDLLILGRSLKIALVNREPRNYVKLFWQFRPMLRSCRNSRQSILVRLIVLGVCFLCASFVCMQALSRLGQGIGLQSRSTSTSRKLAIASSKQLAMTTGSLRKIDHSTCSVCPVTKTWSLTYPRVVKGCV